jgi:hypothetical protein
MLTTRYDLHGQRLAVTAYPGSEEAAAAVHARLAGLPASAGAPNLTFEMRLGEAATWQPPAGGRTVYEPPAGDVLYDDAGDRLFVTHGPELGVA